MMSCVIVNFIIVAFTSTEKIYTGGRKPIFSDVYRNRQC
jgi:hypothetical protein